MTAIAPPLSGPGTRRLHGRTASACDRHAAALNELARTLETVYAFAPGVAVSAIRWMWLKHPLQPAQEELLKGAVQRSISPVSWALRMLRSVLFGAYLSLQLIRLRIRMGRRRRAILGQRFDIVARTCCFAAVPPEDACDFYFGNLQERLAARGIRMLLLCGDGTGGTSGQRFANGQTVTAGLGRLPELALVPLTAPLRMAGEQLDSCLRLLRAAALLPESGTRRAAVLAALDCLSQDTALTGLMFSIGDAAARQWRPHAFMTLCEGHAWEACLHAGVKHGYRLCRTAGYQHTAIFPESLAMTSPSAGLAGGIPEIVFGLGQVPLDLMRPGHERFGTRLVPFGSFRSPARSVADHPADPGRRTILVTPEGIPSEVRLLFGAALACAKQRPAWTFILRSHPQIPMPQAAALCDGALQSQPNIILSEGRALEEDLDRASVLMYRGSSTALYAILKGVRPVAMSLETAPAPDPLYWLSGWRLRCEGPEDFVARVEEQDQALPDQREAEWASAAEAIRRYLAPVTNESIERLLATLGISGDARG